jgi:dihydrodipicolinate synthase/N-acetylneuraminate lyase
VAAGAQGVVWGLANVVPDMCLQFWDAVAVQGDLGRGRQLWAKLRPLCKFFESVGYAAAVKTSMELLRRPTGGMRKPFALLHNVQRIELEKH